MFAKKCTLIGWSMTLILGIATATSAAPKLTPSALDKVIEGAKKEGTVTVILSPEYGEESMKRLEKEVKEQFGVALTIKYTPSGVMAKSLATAIMEYKTGATPSYDLEYYSSSNVVSGQKSGVFEDVDWKSLMTKDTPPEGLLPAPFNSLVISTTNIILMYNPEKVSADAVPKTLSELAAPKWKGKVGIFNYLSKWSKWWLVVGKDKGKAAVQGIMKNGAFQGSLSDLNTRFMIGEIWMAITQSNFFLSAQSKGVSAKWIALRDMVESNEGCLVVRKGAKHPNAAKLVAVYLASPAGSRFTLETAKYGNTYIPGNLDYDIVVEAKKQKIPVVFTARDQKLIEFEESKMYQEWMKEVKLTFETL
jgi:iron(III) transport system substrate-binding protein